MSRYTLAVRESGIPSPAALSKEVVE